MDVPYDLNHPGHLSVSIKDRISAKSLRKAAVFFHRFRVGTALLTPDSLPSGVVISGLLTRHPRGGRIGFTGWRQFPFQKNQWGAFFLVIGLDEEPPCLFITQRDEGILLNFSPHVKVLFPAELPTNWIKKLNTL